MIVGGCIVIGDIGNNRVGAIPVPGPGRLDELADAGFFRQRDNSFDDETFLVAPHVIIRVGHHGRICRAEKQGDRIECRCLPDIATAKYHVDTPCRHPLKKFDGPKAFDRQADDRWRCDGFDGHLHSQLANRSSPTRRQHRLSSIRLLSRSVRSREAPPHGKKSERKEVDAAK